MRDDIDVLDVGMVIPWLIAGLGLLLPGLIALVRFGIVSDERAPLGDSAHEDLATARDRLQSGRLDSAEALARKVLEVGAIDCRALARLVLADVAEVRGEWSAELAHLDAAFGMIVRVLPPPGTDLDAFAAAVREHKVGVAAKRAFALAALGRLEDAEAALDEVAATRTIFSGDPLVVRARTLVMAKRERWSEIDRLLGECEASASPRLGPRSKLLLRTLAARAKSALAGAYRAPSAATERDDEEHRAWLAKVLDG